MAVEAPGAPAEAPTEEPTPFVALAKQTLIYGMSGIALSAIGVITLPIYGHIFSVSEFGVLELATTVSSVALTLIDAGFASAAQRSFYDYGDDQREQRRRVIFTALAFTSSLGLVVAVTLAVASERTSGWLLDGQGRGVLVAVAVSLPIVNAANLLRETMRLRFRAWHYVTSSILAAAVAAGVGIAAVVYFDRGVEGVFLGVIVGNALAAAYGAVVVRADVGRHADSYELRRMLAYGLPLVPAGLAMWSLVLIDRILLSKLANLAEVGQYAVANRISSVLLLAVTAFSIAFPPFVFSIHSKDRDLEKAVRGKTLTYLTVCLCAAGLPLTLFAREVIAIVAPAFDTAYEAVGLLMLSIVALGISAIVLVGISLVRMTKVIALVAIAAAAVNIAFNFALIPPFGMIGAAAATAIGFSVLAAAQYGLAQRYYETPYEPRKVLTTIALATATGAVGLMPTHPLGVSISVKVLSIVAFLLLLRLTGVVDASEVRRVRELLRSATAVRLS